MLTAKSLAMIGVRAAFSDAADGGVRDEHDPLAEKIAWRAGFHLPLHQCRQLHGDGVWWVEWGGSGAGADILLSRRTDLTLAVRTADCLPLLLADGEAGVIAAVHAGWRGTALDIAGRAVAMMCEIGASRAQIRAVLGPAIGGCCFRVRDEALTRLEACGDGIGMREHEGGVCADLTEINRYQLQRAGVSDGRIEVLACCTCCGTGYFSHRRDQTPWRQLALIGRSDSGR